MGNLVGNSCRKILWENLVGKSNLAGNSCGKFLQENLVGKKANLRKAVIGGNVSIWKG